MSVDLLEFSCRYPSASRPVTSKILIHIKVLLVKWKKLHLERIYFFFPEIIFSAEILTVHIIDLIL